MSHRVLPVVDAVMRRPGVRFSVYATQVLREAAMLREHQCHPKREPDLSPSKSIRTYRLDRLDGDEAGYRRERKGLKASRYSATRSSLRPMQLKLCYATVLHVGDAIALCGLCSTTMMSAIRSEAQTGAPYRAICRKITR